MCRSPGEDESGCVGLVGVWEGGRTHGFVALRGEDDLGVWERAARDEEVETLLLFCRSGGVAFLAAARAGV